MFKKIVSVFILALVLTSCAGEKAEDASQSSLKEVKASENRGENELAPFKNVNINIMSGDIIIEKGDSFSLSYFLHGREKVVKNEISDETFYFETSFGKDRNINPGNWNLTLTIPDDAVLENLKLSTVSGDVILKEREFKEGIFKSVSGGVEAEKLKSDRLNLESVSGKLNLKESDINEISAKTTSSDIFLEGSFKNINAKSVSGKIDFEGVLNESAYFETVSSDIKALTNEVSLKADTVGKIKYKDISSKRTLEIDKGEPEITAKSVSGDILIN